MAMDCYRPLPCHRHLPPHGSDLLESENTLCSRPLVRFQNEPIRFNDAKAAHQSFATFEDNVDSHSGGPLCQGARDIITRTAHRAYQEERDDENDDPAWREFAYIPS